MSGDVDFDSFGMAPWDAGRMHGDRCQLCEALRTIMLQWLMRLLCRQVLMNGLDRTMRMNTENRLDTIKMTKTDSPRLTVTPGEWYASDMLTQIRRDLRQTNGFPNIDSASVDYGTGAVELDDMTFRRLSFPLEEFATGCDRNYADDYSILWGFPILILPWLPVAQ